MNVDRPSEHNLNQKLFLEGQIQDMLRSEWPYFLAHFVSIGFFAGQYFRVAIVGEPMANLGAAIFNISGIAAFGMIFFTGSTLKTIWRLKRELRRMERADQKLIR